MVTITGFTDKDEQPKSLMIAFPRPSLKQRGFDAQLLSAGPAAHWKAAHPAGHGTDPLGLLSHSKQQASPDNIDAYSPTAPNVAVRWVIRWSPLRRARSALAAFLAGGLTPEKLALAVAVGTAGGLFPIFGMTTAVSAIAGIAFRLNPVVVQISNYLMYPVYFPCVLVLIVLGEHAFGRNGRTHGIQELKLAFHNGLVSAARILALELLHAALVWAVLAPLFVLVVWRLALPVIRRWRPEHNPVRARV
jgi:uncharacterized protein (DUF2062 family)